MSIRKYEDKDFSSVLSIYNRSKLDELKFEEAEFTLLPLDQDEKRLSGLMASEIYVTELDDIAAYGAVYGSEIRALFVDPLQRGRGIGKALLELLLSKVEGEARLFVAKTNEPAKALYQAYGFNVIDEFVTDYNGQAVWANEMVRVS